MRATPLNIVVVSDSASTNGGAAKVALTEAKALAEAGHHVHLLCAMGPIAPELAAVEGLRVHLLNIPDINGDPQRLRAMSLGLWNPKTYQYMADLLDSLPNGNTVVHVHSWTRALSSSVLKAALTSNLPMVMTLHDYLMGCPQGTFFDQREERRCQLKPMGTSCLARSCDVSGYSHKLWRAGRKFVQDKVSGVPRKLKHYIYVSDSSLQVLKPFLPTDATFYHLPNPINVPRGESAPVGLSEEFCFVGRFAPEKGALIFAQAAAMQSVAARFIGEGPQRDQILKINPAAQMSGWMNSIEIPQALRGVRALVFPSIWNEVLGLIVLEAAAVGVPSIVPRGCGAEESVMDGVTGLHFHSGSVTDLADKIGVLRDPLVAATLGRAAYDTFWSTLNWSIPTHVQRLESIYARMLLHGSIEHSRRNFAAPSA